MRILACVAALSLLASLPLSGQTANHVVISEFATRGADSATDEFVELYNPTAFNIDLGGWKLQYKAQAGTSWSTRANIPSGKTIPSRGFFLIARAEYTGSVQADYLSAEWSQGIADNGHVKIVNSSGTEVDKVGYGSGVVDPESSPAPNHGTTANTNSVERKARASSTADSLSAGGLHSLWGNGFDTDNNANDFVLQNRGRNPQNSASPKEPPGAGLAGIGTAVVAPSVVKADTALALSFIIKGSAEGAITSIKIPYGPPFNWSRISTDVAVSAGERGTVVLGADTLIVRGLMIGANDSVVVTISRLCAPDTTTSVVFYLETGSESDSTALISPLPKLLLYGNPRSIAEMRANDAGGIPVNLQKLVTVRGIVTVSTQFGGPSFIQDASGGIAVFDNAFSSSVHIGDEVLITGSVSQFNGLTELASVTFHRLYGGGNDVVPTIVTTAQLAGDGVDGVELFEGMLVQLNGVVVRDTADISIGTWHVPPGQSGANYRLRDTSGSITVRIDKDVDFVNTSAPAGEFSIIGIVSQYAPAPPYVGGYQLQPRSHADIVSSGPLIIVPPYETNITATSLTVNWQTANPGSSFVKYRGLKTYEGNIVGDTTGTTLHAVTISSLSPAMMYTVQAFSVSGTDTSYSGNRVISTASQGSSGEINVYFNKSVNTALARAEAAKGNADLVDRLLQRINSAQKSIDCALYSISGSVGRAIAEALVQAKSRGVSVRLVIEKDNITQRSDGTFPGTYRVFDEVLIPGEIRYVADDFDAIIGGSGLHHNKFFVFDYRGGAADKAWVWTGSWNLTDPGTNDDFQNAIEIQDQALAGAYTLEFEEMWGSEADAPSAENSRFGARKIDNTPHIFNVNGTPVELYFSPSDRTTSAIIKTLNKAQHSVNVALLTFTRSDVAGTLKSKNDGGVKVRAILDNSTDSGSQFSFLAGAGVDVRLDTSRGLLHHKYAVIDAEVSTLQQYVITGSHNWTNSAENVNNENTLIIQSNRIANQYLQEFAARYKEAGGTEPIVLAVEMTRVEKPTEFWLGQNYPNPFNSRTSLEFGVASLEFVRFKVFDVLGREVAVLVNEEKPAGTYRVTWDASNISSGVYFLRLEAGGFKRTVKTVLVR